MPVGKRRRACNEVKRVAHLGWLSHGLWCKGPRLRAHRYLINRADTGYACRRTPTGAGRIKKSLWLTRGISVFQANSGQRGWRFPPCGSLLWPLSGLCGKGPGAWTGAYMPPLLQRLRLPAKRLPQCQRQRNWLSQRIHLSSLRFFYSVPRKSGNMRLWLPVFCRLCQIG